MRNGGSRARPPLFRLVLYTIGLKLPDRYDDWVFHDLNDRGWRVRVILRVAALAAPFIVGAMFLPGAIAIRLWTASIFVVGPVFIAAAYSSEFREYRLRQHGLLPPSERNPD